MIHCSKSTKYPAFSRTIGEDNFALISVSSVNLCRDDSNGKEDITPKLKFI